MVPTIPWLWPTSDILLAHDHGSDTIHKPLDTCLADFFRTAGSFRPVVDLFRYADLFFHSSASSRILLLRCIYPPCPLPPLSFWSIHGDFHGLFLGRLWRLPGPWNFFRWSSCVHDILHPSTSPSPRGEGRSPSWTLGAWDSTWLAELRWRGVVRSSPRLWWPETSFAFELPLSYFHLDANESIRMQMKVFRCKWKCLDANESIWMQMKVFRCKWKI